jgi:hypothetical protein
VTENDILCLGVQYKPVQSFMKCNELLHKNYVTFSVIREGLCYQWGRDSAVCMVTRYGLEGPRIESRWEMRSSAPVQTGPGAHTDSNKICTRSFPGVKRPGRGVDHPLSSSAVVKERVELHLYSPFGSSWPVLE